MAGGSAIRGSRIGSGPMGEAVRGDAAPRRTASFYCANRHDTVLSFSAEAVVPEVWDCPRCGMPASEDRDNPPSAIKVEPYKTHLAYAKERRSDDEAQEILDEALSTLRARRKRGDVVF